MVPMLREYAQTLRASVMLLNIEMIRQDKGLLIPVA
jgi:hypothetical protein